jgi:protein TonB
VAYRNDISVRDRGGAFAAVAVIHAALLFILLHLSGKIDLTDPQSVLRTFDVRNVPPVPPPPPQQMRQARPKKKEGSSAPKNIRSAATPVVAPKPRIVTPPVQLIVASTTPRQALAPTQGASTAHGPGTGAGGNGNGTGSGNGGNGPGGGGDGGVADPPRLITSVLRGYDFSSDTLDRWPPGVTIFMRLRVDARGLVSECLVDRGTGIAAIDGQICNLAHERLRFRPALNRSGQPVAGWFGYAQPSPR